ncbi:hypothetical protein, partial [Kitasatospora sp. NPDC001225]
MRIRVRRQPSRRRTVAGPRGRSRGRSRRPTAPTAASSLPSVSAMERLMAANSAELVRADTKAAVF